jgi:hypothetical protein
MKFLHALSRLLEILSYPCIQLDLSESIILTISLLEVFVVTNLENGLVNAFDIKVIWSFTAYSRGENIEFSGKWWRYDCMNHQSLNEHVYLAHVLTDFHVESGTSIEHR